jgi:hypothetical protein
MGDENPIQHLKIFDLNQINYYYIAGNSLAITDL